MNFSGNTPVVSELFGLKYFLQLVHTTEFLYHLFR